MAPPKHRHLGREAEPWRLLELLLILAQLLGHARILASADGRHELLHRGRIVLLLTPVEAPATPQVDASEKDRDKPATKGRRQRAKETRAP